MYAQLSTKSLIKTLQYNLSRSVEYAEKLGGYLKTEAEYEDVILIQSNDQIAKPNEISEKVPPRIIFLEQQGSGRPNKAHKLKENQGTMELFKKRSPSQIGYMNCVNN